MAAHSARPSIGPFEVVGRLGATPDAYLVRHARVAEGDGAAAPRLSVLRLVPPAGGRLAEARLVASRFALLAAAHPAIVQLEAAFVHDDTLALVFEPLDGVSLARLKGHLERDHERLPDPAIWHLGGQMMGALARCHLARDAQGRLAPIVHGRLSAHEVLVSWTGAVRVTGLCPLFAGPELPLDEDDKPEQLPLEAQAWLAPEVRRGWPASPRSDVYGAAMLLRSLLTGEPPASGGVELVPLGRLRPDIPEDVAIALDLALEPLARERTVSCSEVEQRLTGLAEATGGQAAMRETMELFQALWGLWSVSALEPQPTGEPSLPSVQIAEFAPDVSQAIGSSEVAAETDRLDAVGAWAADKADQLDAMAGVAAAAVEPPPITSRSAQRDERDGAEAALPGGRGPDAAAEPADTPPAQLQIAARCGPEVLPDGDELPEELQHAVARPSPGRRRPSSPVEAAAAEAPPSEAAPRSEPAVAQAVTPPVGEPAATPRSEPAVAQAVTPPVGEPAATPSEPAVAAEDTLDAEPPSEPEEAAVAPAGARPRPARRRRRASRVVRLGWLAATLIVGAAAAVRLLGLDPGRAAGRGPAGGAGAAVSVALPDPAVAASSGPRTTGAQPLTQPRSDAGAARPADAGADAPVPAASASVAAGTASPLPPVTGLDAGADGTELLHYQTYLIVRSRVAADVYVHGKRVGPTNHKNLSRCRWRNVRLGIEPGPRWISDPVVAEIPCQTVHSMSLEPSSAP